MASLATAALLVADPAHKPLRDQITMGMWYTAQQRRAAGTDGTTGPDFDLSARVLRGDDYPVAVAIRAVATNATLQDAYTASGKLSDTRILDWISKAWATIAGLA